ncbi:PhoH family protein [Petrotoga sp. 9PW.55.5.1]|jgi:phosphate starvation-inducible PhoH-like protein|uniref:PhoH family protein n=1 Tax=Petrotoga sp. 9PW.55.5.1 TaxID=1308979 RepID=UPI0018F79BF5|nr:PhoH family protein [Petrotoga sp. 9PW.55.5.1]
MNVDIHYKNRKIYIEGKDDDSVNTTSKIFSELLEILDEGHLLDWDEFQYVVSRYKSNGNGLKTEEKQKSMKEVVNTCIVGTKIFAKTEGQANYIDYLKNNDIVFSIGPAGTGKTYLAVAMAVDYLRSGKVQRIILTRPAVEAGEKLGFLPGNFYEKVDPYLRPLYDALLDFMDSDKLVSYREKGIIEILPLAYMRGRTLNNSFIILDEAQNTTYQQMKMFLTRIGFNSRVVITGDITQIDLEKKKDSGLLSVKKVLGESISGIKFIELSNNDVVRNPLVKKIIRAYEEYENEG